MTNETIYEKIEHEGHDSLNKIKKYRSVRERIVAPGLLVSILFSTFSILYENPLSAEKARKIATGLYLGLSPIAFLYETRYRQEKERVRLLKEIKLNLIENGLYGDKDVS